MERQRMKIAIYGGSFNPPGRHHIRIVRELTKIFDLVIMVPCGGKREDKDSITLVDSEYRKKLVQFTFENLTDVIVDYDDLDKNIFTPTYHLQEKYENLYPDVKIWHIVGTDIIKGGGAQDSEIHRIWKYGGIIWQSLNWVIIYRSGYDITENDMPPSSMLVKIQKLVGSGTMIREHIAEGRSISRLVISKTGEYIRKYDLYKKVKEGETIG